MNCVLIVKRNWYSYQFWPCQFILKEKNKQQLWKIILKIFSHLIKTLLFCKNFFHYLLICWDFNVNFFYSEMQMEVLCFFEEVSINIFSIYKSLTLESIIIHVFYQNLLNRIYHENYYNCINFSWILLQLNIFILMIASSF